MFPMFAILDLLKIYYNYGFTPVSHLQRPLVVLTYYSQLVHVSIVAAEMTKITTHHSLLDTAEHPLEPNQTFQRLTKDISWNSISYVGTALESAIFCKLFFRIADEYTGDAGHN